MMNLFKKLGSIPKIVGRFFVRLPRTILHLPKNIYHFFRYRFWKIFVFVLLLNGYLVRIFLMKVVKLPFFPKKVTSIGGKLLVPVYQFLLKLNTTEEKTIHRVHLIELALRNMNFKRTRSIITIGGMSLGVATIVFLVSLGYGVQELVVSRVARLAEMKQADVTPQPGSEVRLNDKTLASINGLPNVESVLPLIGVVGRVNYKNSVSDMAVYGVTSEYLRESAIRPVVGDIFESNELSKVPEASVAGVSTKAAEKGATLNRVEFEINPGEWIRVREGPELDAEILGYTKRVEGKQTGVEYVGEEYDLPEGGSSVYWIESPVLLWEEAECVEGEECEVEGYKVMRDADGTQVQKKGYFAEIFLSDVTRIRGRTAGEVLAATDESTESAVLLNSTEQSTDSAQTDPLADLELGDGEFVTLDEVATSAATAETTKVELANSAQRQAVVNRAMLKILNISENEAVGETFQASFVVVGDLLGESTSKVESVPAEYTIVGVTPDEQSPVFYVPFIDLRSLGIVNFSQLKVVSEGLDVLSDVRNRIESLGFNTSSVADTVARINDLFGTARSVLTLLGMSALGVAALGMFNTLTVSLLERTREVGLMKALGMKSSEVKELFLTESMIMGFFGGVLGIFIGYFAAKMLGVGISIFAIGSGVGWIDVAHLPVAFILFVVGLSLFVGLVTGFYPSRRATKISALNALRYE